MPYVSFSGGKDSTVLAHIAREIDPCIPLVFMDTGLEYPEIRKHVKSYIKDGEKPKRIKIKKNLCDVYEKSNLYIMYPVKYFRQVIEEYGYPIISKEVSECIDQGRKSLVTGKYTYRLARLNGELKNKDGGKSQFNHEKWKFLLNAPFKISNQCCNFLKKQPAKAFDRAFNGVPMLALMADESRLRTQKYLKEGCNGFNSKRPKSQPMAFWTEQDVLHYIKEQNIPYASVYGDIIQAELDAGGNIQTSILSHHLMTTGAKRTGCMFCMFGVHLEKGENRFQRMHYTHPKQYDACINKLGCGKVLDYIGVKY